MMELILANAKQIIRYSLIMLILILNHTAIKAKEPSDKAVSVASESTTKKTTDTLTNTNQQDWETRTDITPEHRELVRKFRKQYLERFEKDGIGKPERINDYIRIFKEASILDKKIWLFDVKGRMEGETVLLEGDVNAPEFKNGLNGILNQLGFKKIENCVRVLPDDVMKDTPYGLIIVYASWMYRDPDIKSETLNQALYGDPVRLLKPSEDNNFYFIQSPDAYLGWILASDVKPISKDKYINWQKQTTRIIFTKPANLTPQKGSSDAVKVPAGANLPQAKGSSKRNKITVQLPDERIMSTPKDTVVLINIKGEAQKARVKAFAEELMGVGYKWGGITEQGIDCSGFTQYIYKRIGVNLPRDADQQAGVGRIVAYRDSREGLLPGDLLFFVGRNGKISHVAMSLGGQDIVHSSGKNVHYASFDPDKENYNDHLAKGFFFAKRIFIEGFPAK